MKLSVLALLAVTVTAPAQVSDPVRPYVHVDAPLIAITHVRVIDGSGAPARDDQTVLVAQGKISAVGSAARIEVAAGARVLEKRGYTLLPGCRTGIQHQATPGRLPAHRTADAQGRTYAPSR